MYLVARVPVCYTLPLGVSVYELLAPGSSYLSLAPVDIKEEDQVIDLGEVEQKIYETRKELCVRIGLGGDTYIRLGDLCPDPIGKLSIQWRINQSILDKESYPKKMHQDAFANTELLRDDILASLRRRSHAKLSLVKNIDPPSIGTVRAGLGSL